MLRSRHLALAFLLATSGPAWADNPPDLAARWHVAQGMQDGLVAVTIGRDGLLYVSRNTAVESRVTVYSTDGADRGPWCQGAACGQPPTGFYRDLCFTDHGTAFTVDMANDRVVKLTSVGVVQATWGDHGSPAGGSWYPSGLTIDGEGFVYVANGFPAQVQKFTEDGAFVSEWSTRSDPGSMAVDVDGNILVGSIQEEYVQVFTPDGALLREWVFSGGSRGEATDWSPVEDLTVDSHGDVYITQLDGLILKYSATGEFLYRVGLDEIGDSTLQYPLGVAVDAADNVFVVDFGRGCILKYAPQSTPVMPTTWGSLKRRY